MVWIQAPGPHHGAGPKDDGAAGVLVEGQAVGGDPGPLGYA